LDAEIDITEREIENKELEINRKKARAGEMSHWFLARIDTQIAAAKEGSPKKAELAYKRPDSIESLAPL
jgi:hypothetical protein